MSNFNIPGFTLVEIIVVLLIIGILLAITIPSIMGYVGKAKNAQIEAEARSGYVAAQTIVARNVAAGSGLKNANDDTSTVTSTTIGKELGDTETITKAGCVYDDADSTKAKNIVKCAFQTKSGGDTKYVVFDTTNKEEPTKTTTETPTGINLQ